MTTATAKPDHEAIIKSGPESLTTELQAGVSPRFLALMQAQARFHKYSLNNQLLIFLQRPDATRIAGYSTWQTLGYQVRKGEKGLYILAPAGSRSAATVEETAADGTTTSREVSSARFFRAVAVFDRSQVDSIDGKAKPLDFYLPLGDDHRELMIHIWHAMEAEGLTLTRASDIPGEAQGYTDGKTVTIRASLQATNTVRTLLHEWAHVLLHYTEEGSALPRATKEAQAESAAYVILQWLGVQTPFSADYVLGWGTTADELKASMATIHSATAHIIGTLEKRVPALSILPIAA